MRLAAPLQVDHGAGNRLPEGEGLLYERREWQQLALRSELTRRILGMDSALLLEPDKFSKTRTSREHARVLTRIGSWIVLAALVPIAAWMCIAPLSMAVVAPGFVKVDLNRRPVQHLEGGIVREVLVRDGQHVSAGDPILVLGDVSVDADRNRLQLSRRSSSTSAWRASRQSRRAPCS